MKMENANTMHVNFVRFKASDGVELQGWLSNVDGDTAVVHIHGMSGNGYENHFLDNLREMYSKEGISFFTINTRGHGIISYFPQGDDVDPWGGGTKLGGSCFELFEESIFDIKGAIDFLKTLGKSKFILEGHSLGGSKVVHYLVSTKSPEVIAAILLAPTDMVAWAQTDPRHDEYLKKSEELIARSARDELVGAQCWLDETPLSAGTYQTLCKAGSAVDVYGERTGGSLLGRVQLPVHIVYGDDDIGILKVEGTVDKWVERVNKIKNQNTQISIIQGATHSFKNHESTLAENVESFVKNVLAQ